jgi:2',3'-cyclic-nucleotide 2'-phosphodiesterase (5'-nucleotidase family)
MLKKSMVFKRMAALAAVLLLLAMPAARAAGGSGQALAGTVPRLLTATSDKNARCVECTMGDAIADAVRKYLGADIAIVCGGDLKANLLGGGITWDELRSAFAEDRPLATATVTVRQLREILEAGVSHIRMNASERIDEPSSVYDGFPQISGFTLYYDASAPVGGRVHDIFVDNEKLKLDDDTKTVTLAATAFMLEGGYGLPSVDHAVPSGLTLSDVTARYMNDGMADYLTTGDRIRPMGTADGVLSGTLIAGIIVVAITISVFGRVGKVRRISNSRHYPKMEDASEGNQETDLGMGSG